MDNVHGKHIPLQYVTVKVPGQKPRGSRTTPPSNNGLTEGLSSISISSFTGKDRRSQDGTKDAGKIIFKFLNTFSWCSSLIIKYSLRRFHYGYVAEDIRGSRK